MHKFILEISIAWRYLFNRTDEKFISLVSLFSFIGISLGVATLIIVMSVMNGFREKLITNILGTNGYVNISAVNAEIDNYQNLIKELSSFKNITQVNPLITFQTLINTENNNVGVMTFGLRNINDKKLIAQNIKRGENLLDNSNIIIGSRLAENLNLNIGDKLNLISPKSLNSILGDVPRNKEYNIGGIFETGMHDFDSNVIYMDLHEAQLFFQLRDKVNKIEIFIEDPYKTQELVYELRNLFKKQDLIINDWQEVNSHYLGALQTEKRVMFLILSLIILIATFNIISSLVMLVYEKQKSIAILRSFGLTKNSILRIFIYCGMIISLTGTIAGAIIGIIFSININNIKNFLENSFEADLFNPLIYIFRDIPAKLSIHDTIAIISFSLIISILAVIFPARSASKKDPANLLKYF